jgi:hypothetical protein
MSEARLHRRHPGRRSRLGHVVALLAAAVIIATGPARAEDPAQPQANGSSGNGTPQVALGGQYRINAYSAENDVAGQDAQTAARVRIRQNVDLRFDERLKTHVQLELGHTTSNVGTTEVKLAVRHAVLDYTAANTINFQAGIVPLGDYFGDALFSSDWNYNPVALAIAAPLGPVKARVFAGNLFQGSEVVTGDNTMHYQLDLAAPVGERVQLNAGASLVRMSPDTVAPFHIGNHVNYGAGARAAIPGDLAINLFVIGSRTESALIAGGTAGNGQGVAAKLELTGKIGAGKFGLMTTHATGKEDGTGFIPVQAVTATNGYWGYTGILTVQGPTDTGFDGDSVNISNNGHGLTTVQARYAMPIYGDLGAYAAAGWFGNSKVPAGRSSEVGTDFLLMATYRFNRVLALDFGAGFARLKDSVSGYPNGVGGAFNQDVGTNRTKTAIISRMQAEF